MADAQAPAAASPLAAHARASAPPAIRSGLEAAPVLTLLLAGLVIQFFLVAHALAGDGSYRYSALSGWLDGGRLARTKWPLVGSLPSLPLYLLGRRLGNPQFWVERYNWFLFALALPAFYGLLRRVVARDVLHAYLLLLLVAGTLPHELMNYGAEPFSALTAGVGLLAWQQSRWLAASVLLGLSVANMPATLLGLVLALGWWAWREKRLRALLPVCLGVGIWMLENALRRGSPLASGYEGDHGFRTLLPYSGLPGFSYPIFFGVLSLLFSFGKGLFWFTPGLFLPFRPGLEALGEARQALTLWLLFLAGMVVAYAHWWAWYGGYAWGSRFLVFASLPAALLLAAQVRRPPRRLLALGAVVGALALSCWVGADGVTFSLLGESVCAVNHYQLEALCWYVPEFSVLWRPFVLQPSIPIGYAIVIAYTALVAVYAGWPALSALLVRLQAGWRESWHSYRGRPAWRL